MNGGIPSIAVRPVEEVTVAFDQKPYDLFELQTGEVRLIGLKSEARIDPACPDELRKSSLVEAAMILGPIVASRVTAAGITVYYRPACADAAVRWLAEAATDPTASLCYPYARMELPGTETAPPDEDWNPDPEFCTSLDRDEEHLRTAAHDVLRRLGWRGGVAYDPACSTGTFLSSLKSVFPATRTIGQDRNAGMASLARARLDEVHAGDSIRPAVARHSVDLLVLRHLNVAVTTSAQAAARFRAAGDSLRPGGHCLVFGHTPVQLPAAFFEMQGYRVLSQLAATPSGHALFEFYVLEKPWEAR